MTRKDLKNKYNRLLEDPSQLQPWGDEMVDLIFENKTKIDSYPSSEGLDPEKVYALAYANGKLFWVEKPQEGGTIDLETNTIELSDAAELDVDNDVVNFLGTTVIDTENHTLEL